MNLILGLPSSIETHSSLCVGKIALTQKLPNTSTILAASSIGALMLLVHLRGCKKEEETQMTKKNLLRLPHDQRQPG
jgi:hypothetical protein